MTCHASRARSSDPWVSGSSEIVVNVCRYTSAGIQGQSVINSSYCQELTKPCFAAATKNSPGKATAWE